VNVNELEISGWSFSSIGNPILLEIFIDDKKVGKIKPNMKRPDVFDVYPSYKEALESGFSSKVNVGKINEGEHVMKVVSKSKKNQKILKSVKFQLGTIKK